MLDRVTRVDFHVIVDAIPQIAFLAEADGATEYLNRRGVEYTGVPAEACQGWNWLTLVHPEDAAAARAGWERATRTGEPFHLEYRLRNARGAYLWHAVRALPICDEGGQVLKWIGTATDTHDSRQLQTQLQDSHRELSEAQSLLETIYSTAPIGLGFIDRDFRIVRINEALAAFDGSSVEQELGRTVAEAAPQLWPELEGIFRRVLTTGLPVVDREVSGCAAGDTTQVNCWLTSYYPVGVDGQIIGVGVVVSDITERKQEERARSALLHSVVDAIGAMVEARDAYTAGHERRVARVATAIAAELGLDPGTIEGIDIAAKLHDLGKFSVPAEILSRASKLTVSEFELVKTHARAGYEMLRGIPFPWPVPTMVLQHHERFDGSGYPDGLRGEQIDIGARIVAVADVVEAICSHRPYRAAQSLEAGLDEIARGSGTLYDPAVAAACIRVLRSGRASLESGGS
jgi:PAS domain S-box-containing protein